MHKRYFVLTLFLLGACGNGQGHCTLDALDDACRECLGASDCGKDPLCENGQWQINCRLPEPDAGVPDFAVACEAVDGGGASGLTLTPGSPSSCPCAFPLDATACSMAVTCSYAYPPGTSPGGCLAQCVPGDGGEPTWVVPTCF